MKIARHGDLCLDGSRAGIPGRKRCDGDGGRVICLRRTVMEYDDLLRKAAEALTNLDAEGLVGCYAAEFILDDASSGMLITDKNELREYYDRLFSLPEISFTEVEFFNLGESAAGQWTWGGVSQSGEKYKIRGASLFKLGLEGIREENLFYDPRAAME